jgi:RNA polymerase sigma-70 factor, ECF subfamily
MEIDRRLRELWAASDLTATATLALRTYGPEIMGFLHATHRDEADAADVFSSFCHDMWVGLPKFAWHSSFRTWAYVLARHASLRARRKSGRRSRVERVASRPSELGKVEARVRTDTLAFLKTEVRDRFRALREGLLEDDQLLLVLRVDRQLDYKDIARVLAEPGAVLSDDELTREAARLRKRFQLVKAMLRKAGREAGLVTTDEAT